MSATMEGYGIARPTFTGRELSDLLAFLRQASPQSQAGPVYLLPGRAAVGARLMSDRACLECHAVRGRGAGLAPDLASRSRALTLAEFAAMLWNKAPTMLGMMRTRGIAVPRLEPSDMSDIVAYLYSVRYFRSEGNLENGRRLLVARGCTGCHRPGGSAGSLGRVTNLRTPAAVIAALWSHASLVGDPPSIEAWPSITAEEMADIVSVFLQAGGAQ